MTLRHGGLTSLASSTAFLTQIFVFFLGSTGLIFILIASTMSMLIQTHFELSVEIKSETMMSSDAVSLLRHSFLHYLLWFCFFSWINDLAHKQLRKSLEVANRHKSEFVAKMSHELRTPLFGIVGCLEILEKRVTEEAESLEMAKTCSNNLLQLIDDVLDIAKIETGHITLEIKSVCVDQIIHECLQIVTNQATKKKLHIRHRIEPSPRTFKGDPARLKQVIINILMNAIKFTPEEGFIELCVEYSKNFTMPYAINVYSPTPNQIDFTHSKNGFIQFSIADSGIGLDIREMKKIFNAFEQGDTCIQNRYGGYGLGLDISNQLISKMGGMLVVYSDGHKKGSTFQFIIPYEVADDVDVHETKVTRSTKKTSRRITRGVKPFILIVEDNEINQKILKKMLEDLGCKCEVASNGMEALGLVKDNKYDLIFMDLEMPVLDGVACTCKIRELKIQTPIVGLSAHTKIEHRHLSTKAGMNDFITKPVVKATLEEILDTWTEV